MKGSLQLPQAYFFGKLSRPFDRKEEHRQSQVDILSREAEAENPGRQTARVCKAEYQREESFAENSGDLQRSPLKPSTDQHRHVRGLPKPGKRTKWETLQGQYQMLKQGWEQRWFPFAWVENLSASAFGRIHRRVLPQKRVPIDLRKNADLILCNKL